MTQDPMLYTVQLEMLEQKGVLDDDHAIDLVRSEFALAHNAGRFNRVTASDILLGAVERDTPQEGVTRYTVEAFVEERQRGLDDERAEAILCQAVMDAFNASYFTRICEESFSMQLVSREPAGAQQRTAA